MKNCRKDLFKKAQRKVSIIILILAGLFLYGTERCCAVDNPVTGSTYFNYRYAGQNYQLNNVGVPSSSWEKTNTGWDSCLTSLNNKYDHRHYGTVLPKYDPQIGTNVTYNMVDSYYDTQQYSGYTKSGNANSNENCWGFAFSTNNWVQEPNIIAEDNYKSATYEDATVLWNSSHGITVLERYECGYIKKTKEKSRHSAYYEKTWDSPGNQFSSFTKVKPK